MRNIYTIGYGSRPITEFLKLLTKFSIDTVIDIRSLPASRFQPDYSKTRLINHLKTFGIGYLFKGKELGGKPKDRDLYTDGNVDYDKIRLSKNYQYGITEIRSLSQKENICLLCSELKSIACHRSSLVGESLVELGYEVLHINETGEAKAHNSIY